MKKICALLAVFIIFIFGTAAMPQTASARQGVGVDGDAKLNAAEFKLPVVMYHSTFNRNPGKFTVTLTQLENDFKYLTENGFTAVTVGDLTAFFEDGKPLPAKPIMITFDDGYVNNYLYAFPLLKKHGIKCVMSVIGILTDANYKNDVRSDTWSHLTYEQIKEMHDSGLVEIQNHTYNLHKTSPRYGVKKMRGEDSAAYKKMLRADLQKLHDKIKDKTGITMTAIAYPFGGYSSEAVEVIKEMNYKAAFTCNEGITLVKSPEDLFFLKRYNRPSGVSSDRFFRRFL